MVNWFMLSLIGEDKPGIVAQVTRILFDNKANLGEASMQRIGGYFAMMLMFSSENNNSHQFFTDKIKLLADDLGLTLHIDPFQGQLHQHKEANVCVNLYGSDRAGIVAIATEKLAQAGLHILTLNTDVGGSEHEPMFVMEIEGHAAQGVEALQRVVSDMDGYDIHVSALDTIIA